MRHIAKGFSLIELLVTVSLVGILAAIAIPNFTSSIQSNKADTELSDLQRALNYARLEAINRGVAVRIAPTSGTAWTGELQVYLVSDANKKALRTVAAMSSGGTLVADPNVAAFDFNNLGGLIAPSSLVTMTYTRGSTTKTMSICLTGRIVLSGSCNAQ
ncbi:general secretion pathway protein GspH [Pseudomonas amygdali pv. morsprunorum]|uniref:Type II secretion system protein H n=2 Tax=Pseudomonas syringae group TaxID=136849 RepID=A0A0P9MCG8_PSESX|nr:MULTISPECIES: GspH/FimT family pseudopilin [Pseudomonas syringae group]PPS30489.1 general secretion pathway protein GspH [Pseudomonas amygdali pv. morsprunorum]KPW80858.1 putative Type IV pilin [Pseudomonas syringae pv. cerasicola]KWS86402.1 general secretion pathway protein GspH [Pseudomonas syringae pv. cerasicola]PHN70511.1 general secretion pathway protein GspH [Pseudomonas syringae pv. cerasicola]PHN72032.1 general secretion pathway protein GspH [Pseudomonas syringae pv. cerasicola]